MAAYWEDGVLRGYKLTFIPIKLRLVGTTGTLWLRFCKQGTEWPVSTIFGGWLPAYDYYWPTTTSISNVATYKVRRTRTSLGDRSFTVAGPRSWNNLSICNSEHTFLEFRRLLNTHLFCWGQRRILTVVARTSYKFAFTLQSISTGVEVQYYWIPQQLRANSTGAEKTPSYLVLVLTSGAALPQWVRYLLWPVATVRSVANDHSTSCLTCVAYHLTCYSKLCHLDGAPCLPCLASCATRPPAIPAAECQGRCFCDADYRRFATEAP